MKPSVREATDRFVAIAFEENPNIKDVSEFKSALITAFDTPRGHNFVERQFNDDELDWFFNSQECKNRIKDNVSEKEYKIIYGETKRDEWELQRKLPKGKKVKINELKLVYTPKKIITSSHIRRGKPIKSYNRGFRRWTPAETSFLKIRKQRKLTPKQIVSDFNAHFKDKPRTSSSLKTKVYRI
jgi:hypothetical protein